MRVGWIALGLVLSMSPASLGATVSLTPTADVFVSSANPANNYGAAGGLAASASGLPKGEFQTLLRFNTSPAVSSFDATYGAGQWTLQSATLVLNATAPNNPIFNANAAGSFTAIWMQNDTWIEGTGGPNAPTTDGVTYGTLPAYMSPADAAIGTFSYNGASSGAASYALALHSSFISDIGAGGSVSLRLAAADSSVSYLFNSRTLANPALRPALILTAIPEPAALWLAGLLIGWASRSRRR